MTDENARFEPERVVGSGAMGTVFRARDRETGAAVALKILRHDARSAGARFDREAAVVAHLAHPAIVRYLGHGVNAQGERYLAMEWLDGESLADRLRRTRLTLGEAVELGVRIAGALAAAHQARVVHRDVKPSNIMLVGGRLSDARLIDFGVAAWGGADAMLTRTGDVLGTVAYMAPEQATGGDVGPAADVYALGCVLHEAACGRPPSAVRVARPDLPAPLAQLLARMIDPAPSRRPADGAVVLAALERLVGIELTMVPPAAPPPSGFDVLAREAPAALSPTSSALLAVLGRHVPMPLALLRAQCARLGKELGRLGPDDVDLIVPSLATAAASFSKPGRHAAILDDLRALLHPTGPACP